jgi:hypothetical protein
MEQGTVVDYTTMRRSKKRRIADCPRCGRKGAWKAYINNRRERKVTDGIMIHQKKLAGIFWEVFDSCPLSLEQVQMLKEEGAK